MSERPKALLLEARDEPQFDFFHDLKSIADLTFEQRAGGYTEDDLEEMIKPYAAVMITSQHSMTKRVIQAASKLRVIAKRGAIPENVDYDAAARNGVLVCWTPGVNYESVAEHTVMLMLSLAKRTVPLMQRLSQGSWREANAGVRELFGKTLGIIGVGGIGRAVCRTLEGFRMRMLAYDPYLTPEQKAETSIELCDLDELLVQSDYVTIHAALTEETRHIIGSRELSLMKSSAFLINTSRGGLIDEPALVDALKRSDIAGAGLDVFDPEPPAATNPLFELPNVVLTPHMAGWSDEAVYREQKEAVEEIRLVLEGKEPRYPVNR